MNAVFPDVIEIVAVEGALRVGSPWQDPPQTKSLFPSPSPPGFATVPCVEIRIRVIVTRVRILPRIRHPSFDRRRLFRYSQDPPVA